jgi:hypothetical protein
VRSSTAAATRCDVLRVADVDDVEAQEMGPILGVWA